jgi:hypothetical protein
MSQQRSARIGVQTVRGGLDVCDSSQMPDSQDRAAERVRRALPAGAWEAIEHDLSPTGLQTLLIAVASARAHRITAADVMRRWQHDRFVRPAASDPRRLSAVESRLWQLARRAGLVALGVRHSQHRRR